MYCPTCKEHFDGKFCPECGTKLIEAPQTPDFGVNFGSGFAVDGNINVTRTNTTNTYDHRVINTSNVTNIQERQKSDIELLQERKNRYFTACKRAFEDNVLDQDELIQLENYRVELGLSRDDADKLLDKARELVNRNATKSELTGIAKIKLKQLSEALKRNEIQALMQQIDSFEALASKFINEELQYKYFLVLSALKPEKCIEKYETLKVDNYWKSYWSCLAYRKKGNTSKSNEILMNLEAFDTFPEDNTLLLGAACALMDGNAAEATDFLGSVVGEFSPALQRFADSIYYLVDPAMAQELDVKEEKCAFYLVNFFSYKTQAERKAEEEVKRKADEEAKRKAEEEAKRKAEEEAKRKAEEEAKRKAEAEAKRKAEEEAKRKAEEEAKRKVEEAKRRAEAEAKRKAEEAKRRAEAEAKRKAEEEAKPKADEEAKHLYTIGNDYYYGRNGKKQNYAEAVRYYREAAEQGYADAQYSLGYCYYCGDGVDENETEAVKWFRKAAEQGNADAQFRLGQCYDCGRGVDKSETEAVKWYRIAAEQGNADAQWNLGYCYENGRGVDKNETEAVKWYRKAAEQGDELAKQKLERLGY